MRFTDYNFNPGLMEGIEASGYETATPIQEQVIPPILAGNDIIASAQTGTGKTAAFLLPLMQLLLGHRNEKCVNAIVIVPTRELSVQIAQHLEGLSYFTDISSIAVYGGGSGDDFITEKKALQNGVDIVICTPGKMIAHLNMGYVPLDGLQFLVLDEADRMLDMGFHDDIMKIINKLPTSRQTLLFSATMPEKIRTLAKKILQNPVEINIAISRPPDKIVQKAFVIYEPQKLPLIKQLITGTPHQSLLIFCSSKQTVKQLTRELKHAKLNVAEVHSDLDQLEREDRVQGFKSGRIPILVATDVLSRGIDIDTIDLVINYDVPHDGEDYVHRIGRTARAEADGMAFTLVTEKDINRFSRIEALIGKTVEKAPVPESLGAVPTYQPRNYSRGANGHSRGGGAPRQGGFKPNRYASKKPSGKGNGRPQQGGNTTKRSTPPQAS